MTRLRSSFAATITWLIISFSVPVLAAPAESLRWAGWEIPGGKIEERGALTIEADADAQSVRKVTEKDGSTKDENTALVQKVNRGNLAKTAYTIAQTSLIKWADVSPGVYHLTARVSFDGDVNLIGTPIAISADSGFARVSQSFSGCDFAEAGKYYELSFDYEVDPTGKKRLQPRLPLHTNNVGAFYSEIYPSAAPPVAAAPNASAGFTIALTIPITKYSVESGLPPNSLRSVKLDWIKLEKFQPSPSITARTVRPAKVWLRPGMEQTFDVALENFTAQPQKRICIVNLIHGIDERQEIHREEIDLAAGAQKKITVAWKTTEQSPQWGYEVRAEILGDGGKIDSSAHDFFSLHPEVYTVLVSGSQSRGIDPFRARESYANQIEIFGATEGDCAAVMPRADQWTSGMNGGVPHSFKIAKFVTDHNAANGIATHMYLFAGGTNVDVLDLYAKHPEWCLRPNATDEHYRKLSSWTETVGTSDFTKALPIMPKGDAHVEMGLNFWSPELMDRITKQTIEFIRRTGYDGIRFDVGLLSPRSNITPLGTKLPFEMKDAMTKAAENFTAFATALRKEFPGFEFGANGDSSAYMEQVGLRDVTPKPPTDFPEYIAFCKAGGMYMDEGTMSAPYYDHSMNRFEDAVWAMVQKRNAARQCGAVYQLFSPHRDGAGHFAHDDVYWTTMIIATGNCYVGNFSAPPYCEDSAGAFITRFGEFFRSKNLKTLTDAAQQIVVNSPAALWYADTAVWEDLNSGATRRYVIPLINSPTAERFRRNKTGELPPTINEPFEIAVKLPEGYSSAKTFMLTWEPRVEAKPLESKIEGGEVKVTFPGIQLFRTLVVEFQR